jgi:protein TonB
MRVLVSFFAAVCMSVALFYLMRYMISSEGLRVDKPPPGATVSLVRIEKSAPGRAPVAGPMPLAPRQPRPPAESLPAVAELASAQPSPPEPPALRAVLPELELIVPNGEPYLGLYEKPANKVTAAVPKPVPPPKAVPKPPARPRKAADGRKEKMASIPTPPALSPVSSPVVAGGGGSGPETGPVVSGGAVGNPGLEDEVIPLLKLAPEYPRKAARAGKEGWVKLEFTITRQGNVSDAAVVDARPRRLFDRSALRAIRKWRFKPKISGGKAVARRATQIIEFNLASR